MCDLSILSVKLLNKLNILGIRRGIYQFGPPPLDKQNVIVGWGLEIKQ